MYIYTRKNNHKLQLQEKKNPEITIYFMLYKYNKINKI